MGYASNIISNFATDRLLSVTTFWKNKKRYAYLELENLRNFHSYSTIWHDGFPRIAWAAVNHIKVHGFLRAFKLRRGIVGSRFLFCVITAEPAVVKYIK